MVRGSGQAIEHDSRGIRKLGKEKEEEEEEDGVGER